MTDSAELILKLIDEHRILDEAAGLNEPSGLTLNADGSALYTVSDDTKAVFKLDLKGRLSISGSFFVGVDDLEGIALSADGNKVLMVQEETNSIVTVDLDSRRELSRRPLAGMQNYDSIRHYFPELPDNKGLEGITVNTRNDHVFVVKEGKPGVLIEVSADQDKILNSRLLSTENGFKHPKVEPEKLDFSGLSYDSSRDTIWITSDKGQCLFHYDWNNDRVLQRLELTIDNDGKQKRVRKSEGVAIDPERKRLYVVGERDGHLYTYKIREKK
ncbi:MAG: SdiA-regulated domain-containing protein [Cyanobacteriota bacterium]|nr:SdiA-regulated domain-containing protein [Cyanobacteriota bacterium]MED5384071.1 SdiA-regulated domain-containing protein [Cyanobacteriota bacterium]